LKILIYGAVFAGGIATGLYIAKLYARSKTQGAIHDVLPGWLQGGAVEEGLDRLIVPSVSG
jgi:hypothetical protein